MQGKPRGGSCLGILPSRLISIAAEEPVPKLDKARLEQFIRYTEGYTASGQNRHRRSRTKLIQRNGPPAGASEHGRAQKIDKVYFVGPRWADRERIGLESSRIAVCWTCCSTSREMVQAYGPTNAKVTLVVFSDFQCPYCREFAKTIREEIPKKYPNDVRIEFQDFPIASIHKWALPAAEAAHCVGPGNAECFLGISRLAVWAPGRSEAG